MEISFIHTQILLHLHVNKTEFHMKGFALGLALKQRRTATRLLHLVRTCTTLRKQDEESMALYEL